MYRRLHTDLGHSSRLQVTSNRGCFRPGAAPCRISRPREHVQARRHVMRGRMPGTTTLAICNNVHPTVL